jgi:hypothetical protein
MTDMGKLLLAMQLEVRGETMNNMGVEQSEGKTSTRR